MTTVKTRAGPKPNSIGNPNNLHMIKHRQPIETPTKNELKNTSIIPPSVSISQSTAKTNGFLT